MTKRALIVCHAGIGIGLGHLTRSLVVAQALQRHLMMQVTLLIQGDVVTISGLSQIEHLFIALEAPLSMAILNAYAVCEFDVLIMDLYAQWLPLGLDHLLLTTRYYGCKNIAIDGLFEYHVGLDLIFIPSFHCSPSLNSLKIKMVYGWDCFLLKRKHEPVSWRSGKRALILTGGADAAGLGHYLPELLNEKLADDCEVHWVTGPYASTPVWPGTTRLAFVEHVAPACLDELMMASHYALTVYGVGFFELLYYGIPTVVFSPYAHHKEELDRIAEYGLAVVATSAMDAVYQLNHLMIMDEFSHVLSETAKQKMSVPGDHHFTQHVAALWTS